MKKIFSLFALGILIFSSCVDKKEYIEYAQVYFPIATRGDSKGLFEASFNFSKDTTFLIRTYCSGSILTPDDVKVQLALAVDSLTASSIAGYELLPEEAYTVMPTNMALTIRKGTDSADMRVDFHTSTLDPEKKYVLPLRIASVSRYKIAPKYECLFFALKKK